MQTGDTADFSVQLYDTSDGSLVKQKDVAVNFWNEVSSINDALTSNHNIFALNNTNGSLTFSSSGMKFMQDSGDNENTHCFVPAVLDLEHYAYDVTFTIVDWSTTDNTPFRPSVFKVSDNSRLKYMGLMNTTAGWLIGNDWSRTYHAISTNDIIKIHLEDGNYKVYRNGSEVGSNTSLVIDEEVYFGFTHWTDQYMIIKDFKIEEEEL